MVSWSTSLEALPFWKFIALNQAFKSSFQFISLTEFSFFWDWTFTFVSLDNVLLFKGQKKQSIIYCWNSIEFWVNTIRFDIDQNGEAIMSLVYGEGLLLELHIPVAICLWQMVFELYAQKSICKSSHQKRFGIILEIIRKFYCFIICTRKA